VQAKAIICGVRQGLMRCSNWLFGGGRSGFRYRRTAWIRNGSSEGLIAAVLLRFCAGGLAFYPNFRRTDCRANWDGGNPRRATSPGVGDWRDRSEKSRHYGCGLLGDCGIAWRRNWNAVWLCSFSAGFHVLTGGVERVVAAAIPCSFSIRALGNKGQSTSSAVFHF